MTHHLKSIHADDEFVFSRTGNVLGLGIWYVVFASRKLLDLLRNGSILFHPIVILVLHTKLHLRLLL